jgi:hypothetical protein
MRLGMIGKGSIIPATFFVIPARALCHSREGGNPEVDKNWIPGSSPRMTKEELDPRVREGDAKGTMLTFAMRSAFQHPLIFL